MHGPSVPDREVDDLTAAIVRAALDAAQWQDVVERLRAACNEACFVLLRSGLDVHATYAVFHTGHDPAMMPAYQQHYYAVNPWGERWKRMPSGVVFTSAAIMAPGELEQTEFYNDWAKPQDDLKGGAGLIMSSEGGQSFLLGADVRARHLERDEAMCAALLQRLMPTLYGAVAVSRALALRDIELLSAQEGHRAAGSGIFLISRQGRILQANDAGAARLARGGLMASGPDGRVRLHDAPAQAALAEALAHAGRNGGRRLRSLRTMGPGGPEAIHILSLEERAAAIVAQGWFGETSLPAVLLIVEDLTPETTLEGLLSHRMGLTATEAQIALSLASGARPSEIAAARGASVHTVRNQIKSALTKAGVRRQVELVQIVERMRDR